ncbi:MAG: SDR family oxidoreductase [Deltaproteobacteria bacterium]|nr:MAG: SDR family oxidoreductase [Deltaproteobacteria bacterium]
MSRLEGKTAVVTGAASGIGRAMARRFAEEGASVVAVDMDESRLAKVASELGCKMVAGDISDDGIIAQMLDGDVHILCNNAGILDALTPLHEVSDELYAKVMKINVEAPFKAMRAVLPRFAEAGGGVILNTCSAAALSGGRAGAAYTASKHALLGFTRSTAWYYGSQGIRCNAIAPGAIETKMHFRAPPNQRGFEAYQKHFGTMPRHGKAAEVAALAAFLVSDDASYVNGEVISVDGGWNSF